MSDTQPRSNSILVLGAGELGLAVLQALAKDTSSADRPRLSVLLRPDVVKPATGLVQRSAMLAALDITAVHADLATASDASLAAIFSDYATVICCTGFVGGPGTQRRITRAVLAAGVDHYLPWQFGVDYDAVGRSSGQDVWDEQLDVREMLRTQSRTRWTIISTGIFTSFLFEPSFGVVDLVNQRVNALGSWTNRITVTTAQDIGLLTARIVRARPVIEGIIFVAGDTLSYAELADTVDQALGVPVERVLSTVTELQTALAAAPGDDVRKYRLAFAREAGVAWDMTATYNARHGIPVTNVAAWLATRQRPTGT